jgi:hypothetical protein
MVPSPSSKLPGTDEEEEGEGEEDGGGGGEENVVVAEGGFVGGGRQKLGEEWTMQEYVSGEGSASSSLSSTPSKSDPATTMPAPKSSSAPASLLQAPPSTSTGNTHIQQAGSLAHPPRTPRQKKRNPASEEFEKQARLRKNEVMRLRGDFEVEGALADQARLRMDGVLAMCGDAAVCLASDYSSMAAELTVSLAHRTLRFSSLGTGIGE